MIDKASCFPRPIPVSLILQRVHTGQIMLPRFQRRTAWDQSTSAKLVESILKGNPVGLFLTLEARQEKVSGENSFKFKTRKIIDTPHPTHECEELLLDGQQRITSLYRAVTDESAKCFIVQLEESENDSYEVKEVNQRNKLEDETNNYFFPAYLLSWEPHKVREALNWIENHAEEHNLNRKRIENAYLTIRGNFLSFDVPVIKLPKETPAEHAIDIFIQMNQSVAKLSAFDIAVAQMEEEVGESLHERVRRIADKTRLLGQLGDDDGKKERKIGDFALRVFCLKLKQKERNFFPTEGNFLKLNFEEINKRWNDFEEAVVQMNSFLNQEKVWDQKRLPRLVPLHVITALFMEKPSPKTQGFYLRALKKYLWRAFLSDRYSYAANKHMKQDYSGLCEFLESKGEPELVPIFEESVGLPEIEDIREAGWPSRRPHLGKAILILTLKEGAKDIATGRSPSQETITKYQYHHIYPKGYLEDIKESPYIESAVNCMLLEGPTNNEWKHKAPSEYLMEIIRESTDVPANRREYWLSEKMKTHIVPISKLLESKPKKHSTKKELKKNFEAFVEERAGEIHSRIKEMYKLEFS